MVVKGEFSDFRTRSMVVKRELSDFRARRSQLVTKHVANKMK